MVKTELNEKDLQKVGGGAKDKMETRLDTVYTRLKDGTLPCRNCGAKGLANVSMYKNDKNGVFFKCVNCETDTYCTWEYMQIN